MGKVKKYQSEKFSEAYSQRQHLYRRKQGCIK